MLIDDDEERTARLLRLAGPRADASHDRGERVRLAVHREWRTMTRRRVLRRRAATTVVLLTAAAVTFVIVRVTPPQPVARDVPRASVAVIERADAPASGPGAGSVIRAGDWVDTGATGRLALRLAERTSLRLDLGTRLQLVSDSVVMLERGAVYVDTGVDSSRLEVRTPLGVTRDVGTQFEVRLNGPVLRVRVRTGLVELRREDRAMPVSAGSELIIGNGGPTIAKISPSADEWQWAASLAPAFEIEGRTLAAFLNHLSREQGWTITYAEPALARDVSRIILHGSVTGLSPSDALAVAARTSGLSVRFVRSADSTLVIVSRAEDRH